MMQKIGKLLEGIFPLLPFYPAWVRYFLFLILIQVLTAVALLVFYSYSATIAKKKADEKPDPRKSEIVFRLSNIVHLLKNHPTAMSNTNVLKLKDQLTGWYIDGAKKFEGTSTIALLQQLEESDRAYGFLSETRKQLRWMQDIADARNGVRQADVVQNMDYKSLGSIRDHLQMALSRLESR
jgi:hypothetical protein